MVRSPSVHSSWEASSPSSSSDSLVLTGLTERLHFHFSLSCIGEGNGNPLQCYCLENPRDGGAWWAAVYGVTQSGTRLKRLSSSSSSNRSYRPSPWTRGRAPIREEFCGQSALKQLQKVALQPSASHENMGIKSEGGNETEEKG